MIALLQKKCGSNQIHMYVTYNMTTGIDFGSFVCFFLGFVCALSIFLLSCRECYWKVLRLFSCLYGSHTLWHLEFSHCQCIFLN